MIAVRNYCATHGEPSFAPPQARRGATHATDATDATVISENSQNARLKGLSEITVASVASVATTTRAQPTVYRKGGKFFRLFWAHATSRYVGEIFGVSEKTVRNAAEAAEAVDGTPTRPLAGSSCWRCSIHKGRNLRPVSESGSSCYGATTTTTRASQTVYRKGGKFCPLFWAASNRAAAKKRTI